MLQDKKLQPSTINGYRSATRNSPINVSKDQNLTHLLDSFHRDRPKGHRGIPSWNLSLVLHQLTKAPFEPLKEAVRALCYYLHTGSGLRQNKELVFGSFDKDISPATVSSWIKQTVTLCYELSDQEALTLHQVKAHDVWAFASSNAFQSGVQLLSACHWKFHNTLHTVLLEGCGLGSFRALSSGPCGGFPEDPSLAHIHKQAACHLTQGFSRWQWPVQVYQQVFKLIPYLIDALPTNPAISLSRGLSRFRQLKKML